MSKTDKTRPAAVKAGDKPSYRRPMHDHRFGACDLPEQPTLDDAYGPAEDGRCYWGISNAFWCSPDGRCGCPYCSGTQWYRAENRRDRHETRRALRRWSDGEDW